MLHLRAGVTITDLDDEAVITDENSGRYLGLNSTAALMLNLALSLQNEEDVVMEVGKIFSLNRSDARTDLRLLMQLLDKLKLTDGIL